MTSFLRTLSTLLLATALAACSLAKPAATPDLFDLGPLPAAQAPLAALPPLAVADVVVPTWLDRPLMFYRLGYENAQQSRPYAASRWNMPPGQLITQRIKARIAQAGGSALSAADGATGVPVLRIEADDFSQNFSAPDRSIGRIALRASVFRGRALIAQKSFLQEAPAPSVDAEGGARALAAATDMATTDLIGWLATLPLK